MSRFISFLFLLSVAVRPLGAQQPVPDSSRVQWLNAASTAPLEFVLNGTTLSRAWAPGQKKGVGEFPAIKWFAQFRPPKAAADLRFQLELQNGDSAAAVLIGDFAKLEPGTLDPARLPPGHTLNDQGEVIRAALAKIPIAKGRSASYPVYLLNGMPGKKVRVEVEGGNSFDLEYGVPQSFKASPGSRPLLRVEGRKTPVGFEVDNFSRGGLFAFYRSPGKDKIEYGFIRLHSIESSKDRAAEAQRQQERADKEE